MKVTYRGVEYDTNDRSNKSCRKQAVVENYRGIQHTKELLVCSK